MVELIELSPRASLEHLDAVVPLETKLRFCRQLRDAGFGRIEVTGLQPGVPQFRDGVELLTALAEEPGVWRAAVWDRHGAERAVAAGCRDIVVTAGEETASALAFLRPRLVRVAARVEAAFGEPDTPPEQALGALLATADRLAGAGAEELSLVGSAGAPPERVAAFYQAVAQRYPGLPVALQVGQRASVEEAPALAALATAYAAGARIFEVAMFDTRQSLAWLARVGEPAPVRPEALDQAELTLAVAAARRVRPAWPDNLRLFKGEW